jgi:hypothetical protein
VWTSESYRIVVTIWKCSVSPTHPNPVVYSESKRGNTEYLKICYITTASVVCWSEFLATYPEVRVRFSALPDILRSSGSGTVPLSLVSTTEELLEIKSSGSGLESREYSRRNPSRWPRGTLYPQKLALNSPTSNDRSVGTVRSRIKSTDYLLLLLLLLLLLALLHCRKDEGQGCVNIHAICLHIQKRHLHQTAQQQRERRCIALLNYVHSGRPSVEQSTLSNARNVCASNAATRAFLFDLLPEVCL